MGEEFDFEEDLKAVRRVFVEYPKIFKANQEEIQILQEEDSDISHIIELTDFNAYEGYSLAKMSKKIKQERRRLKDQNEYLEKILQLVKQSNVKEKNISKTIGKIREVRGVQENRWYRMKIRKDLQESFDIKRARVKEKEQKETTL